MNESATRAKAWVADFFCTFAPNSIRDEKSIIPRNSCVLDGGLYG